MIYGHAGHFLPHRLIPLCILSGYSLGSYGTFPLIRFPLIFLCLLNAVRGFKYLTGVGVLANHGSPVFCLDTMYGWQSWVIGQRKYCFLVFCLLITLLKGSLRWIPLAISIALFIADSEYPLFSISSFGFQNCFYLFSGFEQILTIPKHSENGIFLVQDGGWHEVGNKYILRSVPFL